MFNDSHGIIYGLATQSCLFIIFDIMDGFKVAVRVSEMGRCYDGFCS